MRIPRHSGGFYGEESTELYGWVSGRSDQGGIASGILLAGASQRISVPQQAAPMRKTQTTTHFAGHDLHQKHPNRHNMHDFGATNPLIDFQNSPETVENRCRLRTFLMALLDYKPQNIHRLPGRHTYPSINIHPSV
ncbi:hypothetical protein [Acidithiobacillus sp.]|uniref:hypothetical protein n=1 Tax=Acidithiobacillus sp. TaxID=1872118 RepID=UPI003563C0A3